MPKAPDYPKYTPEQLKDSADCGRLFLVWQSRKFKRWEEYPAIIVSADPDAMNYPRDAALQFCRILAEAGWYRQSRETTVKVRRIAGADGAGLIRFHGPELSVKIESEWWTP